ncbi:MAG: tetrahydromethanopterin S-methyltransferase subunit H [Candidatus Altiarchaeota archaeon]|nr:tetrahydromethanopterin S-methyltransferase subunit H [Candidatus Altiarchaeota archaeon]
MFTFTREQKVFEVGGVKFGGQPGQNPTVLFGTIFYGKQFKELDSAALSRAKDLILAQEAVSKETCVPGLADVYVKTEDRLMKELNLVLDSTDMPFSIDISESSLRVKALEYLDKVGALDRVVYNSINLGLTDAEVSALKKHTPAAAIVLAYNPKDMTVDGRLSILKDGAHIVKVGGREKGLLDVAKEVGVKNVLLDTGATLFGHSAAETLRAIPVMKSEYGLPVGCAIHNTLESWLWMRDYRKKRPEDYECFDVGVNTLVPALCGDFVVYGPIELARKVFPAIAFTDKLVAEGAQEYFGTEISDGHPYHKLE